MADAQIPDFNITRAQIASFVKEPRTVRDLEAFFRLVRQVQPQLIALAQTTADQGVADAAGAQAVADAAVPQTRLINTTSPIAGGGNLSSDLTFSHATSGVTAATYGDATHVPQLTVDAKGHVTAVTNVVVSGGSVTTTGSPASGNLAKFSGATSIVNGDLSGDVTTSGTLATTLAASGVTAATYGDSTHVAQIAVDAKGRVTSASNVAISGGGGSGNTYAFPQGGSIGVNDTGAFATLSNAFILSKSVTVDKLYALFNSVGAGGTYKMFIATIDNSGNITGTLVTSSTTYTTTGAGAVFTEFSLPSTATLAANTNYICALVITSGSGTTANRGYLNSGSGYPTLPLAWDLMLNNLGGINAKRFWYAQNSSAPSSGAPTSSITTSQYHFGMRAQV